MTVKCYQIFTGQAYCGTSADGEIFLSKKKAVEWLKGEGFSKVRGQNYYETEEGDSGLVAEIKDATLHR